MPWLRRCGGDHESVSVAVLPVSAPAGACAGRCPVTWGLRWAMGIPIRCCPFFFFVASERLSHPPTGAVCGRRFLFSTVPRPLCRSAVRWPVGFSVCHGRGQRPSTLAPAVHRCAASICGAFRQRPSTLAPAVHPAAIPWRGRGSRVRTRRCPWLLGRRR